MNDELKEPGSPRRFFSQRTLQNEPPNALSLALAEARRAPSPDKPFLDLTISNPTTARLVYSTDAISAALSNPHALVYEPDSLGLPAARDAVASEYELQHPELGLSPSRVAITASTSEAYAVLFKMLCDPGDHVLVPVPSYPLLAWLAAFEGVELRTYPLEYAGRWHVNLDALKRAVTDRTRAIVVVNPNNPTGSFLGKDELEAMLDLDLPIISDEVFARYSLRGDAPPQDRVDTVLRSTRGLTFALSGLSKLVGLPQMKLGWIACAGDDDMVRRAMERLEIVLDAYLSVGAPVQHGLQDLLRAGALTRTAIRARTRANLEVVRRAASSPTSMMSVLDVEGGWYATLRVPDTKSDEQWALSLVSRDGVYVHPGYFFDMSRGAHLVVSLLTPEDDLKAGMSRIAARFEHEG